MYILICDDEPAVARQVEQLALSGFAGKKFLVPNYPFGSAGNCDPVEGAEMPLRFPFHKSSVCCSFMPRQMELFRFKHRAQRVTNRAFRKQGNSCWNGNLPVHRQRGRWNTCPFRIFR